jgi:hypothetical protein
MRSRNSAHERIKLMKKMIKTKQRVFDVVDNSMQMALHVLVTSETMNRSEAAVFLDLTTEFVGSYGLFGGDAGLSISALQALDACARRERDPYASLTWLKEALAASEWPGQPKGRREDGINYLREMMVSWRLKAGVD